VEGQTTQIALVATCSVSSNLPSGTVGVDVTFQDNVCPVINQLNVVPQTIAIGQTAQVSVNASDPEGATLQYTWASLAGTFGNPAAAATTYTCTQAIDHNISMTVSDGDSFCNQTRLLNVTCVPNACGGVSCNDGNQCTNDGVCDPVSGCPGSTNSPAGTVCNYIAVGDGFCNGAGACVQCLTATNCVDDGNQCTAPATCTGGVCMIVNSPSGTSCTGGVCNGAGACVGCVVAGDCADDGNQCTAPPTCNAGVCSTVDQPSGTPCTGGVCNGVGLCVECVVAGNCTDDGNQCTAPPTCNAGSCSTTNQPSGTPCTGGVCDGAGVCVGCVVPTDCADDGNECTAPPTCNAGSCSTANQPSGTPCTGGVCDGAGACVGCAVPTDCADDGNECTANTCVANTCGVTNVTDGTLCTGGTCQAGVCTP
jgi:hypothetical protein